MQQNHLNIQKRKRTILSLLLLILILTLCSCANNGGIVSLGGYTYDNAGKYTAGSAQVSGRVDTLDVSWIEGQVTLGFHNGRDILVSETARRSLDASAELRWYLDGSTLYIKYAESGFKTHQNLDKELTVLLPRATELNSVKLSVVSADVKTEPLTANDVAIHSVSGSLHVCIASADRLDLNNVSGGVFVNAAHLNEVKANSVSGNVTLEIACTPDRITADSTSGDVIIRLPEDAGFTAKLSSVSGDVRGNLPMQSQGGKRYTAGNGRCTINVNTVSGDLQLDELK